MRVEVHVHGTVLLKSGTTAEQIEAALRPWLDYVDEDTLADAKSAHPDEPGIVFDRRRRVLEVCWTGDVGRSFRQILADALDALNGYSEEAASFDVTYYHDDGRDEFDVMFVGPTRDAVHQARRRRMLEDLQHLLSREFNENEAGQVLALVDQLFERSRQQGASQSAVSEESEAPVSRKQLH
jgi:hypothetical protein